MRETDMADADKKRKNLFTVVFIVYIAFLMYFLFFSDLFGRTTVYEEYRYNLQPFKEIKRFWTTVREKDYVVFFINIVGNVALFMPFGFLFPTVLISKCKKAFCRFMGTMLAAFIMVGVVETCQLLTKVGVFDVDDIILNVFGAFLGYFVYAVSGFIRRKKRKK